MRNRLPSLFDADLYDRKPAIEMGLLAPWEDQIAPREKPMMMAQNLMLAPYTNMPPEERQKHVERGVDQVENLGMALNFMPAIGGRKLVPKKALKHLLPEAAAETAEALLELDFVAKAWGEATALKAESDRQRALEDFNRTQIWNQFSRRPAFRR